VQDTASVRLKASIFNRNKDDFLVILGTWLRYHENFEGIKCLSVIVKPAVGIQKRTKKHKKKLAIMVIIILYPIK